MICFQNRQKIQTNSPYRGRCVEIRQWCFPFQKYGRILPMNFKTDKIAIKELFTLNTFGKAITLLSTCNCQVIAVLLP